MAKRLIINGVKIPLYRSGYCPICGQTCDHENFGEPCWDCSVRASEDPEGLKACIKRYEEENDDRV